MDSFLDPTCVQVRVSINKLNLVPNWIVAVSCPETAEVWVRASRISLSCSLILSLRYPCFTDEDFAALAGNPVDHAILFSRIDVVL